MSTHSRSAEALQNYFAAATKDKEQLEEKIRKAVNLQNELTELQSSQVYMSQSAINKLKRETIAKEHQFLKSVGLHQQMEQLEGAIASIKNSWDYLEPREEMQIQNQIQFKNSIIKKAGNLQREISLITRNPEFLSETELQSKERKLDFLNTVLKKIQTQDTGPEEARKELQCVRCARFPEVGTPIFSCLEHHLLCSDCVKKNLKFCQICKQNFLQTPASRNSLAERMIRNFQK